MYKVCISSQITAFLINQEMEKNIPKLWFLIFKK